MTEDPWHSSRYAYHMLDDIERSVSPRKLRLVACGWCRLLWSRLPAESRYVVELTERYCDGDAAFDEVLAAIEAAPKGKKFGGSWVSHNPVQIKPASQAQRTVVALGQPSAVEAAWQAARESMTLLQEEQCDVIRDIIYNPYLDALSFGEQSSPEVIGLAKKMYRTQQFDQMPQLADALSDTGCDDDAVLEHCHSSVKHFRGCWVIDAILGQT